MAIKPQRGLKLGDRRRFAWTGAFGGLGGRLGDTDDEALEGIDVVRGLAREDADGQPRSCCP